MKNPYHFLTTETIENPNNLTDLVSNGSITPEEAVCAAMTIAYGQSFRGKFKSINFRQFWEQELCGQKFKSQLLGNASSEHFESVARQVNAQRQQIYDDTYQIGITIRKNLPDLWRVIKNSDIFWYLPHNIDKVQSYADEPGFSDSEPKSVDEDDHLTLSGALSW